MQVVSIFGIRLKSVIDFSKFPLISLLVVFNPIEQDVGNVLKLLLPVLQ